MGVYAYARAPSGYQPRRNHVSWRRRTDLWLWLGYDVGWPLYWLVRSSNRGPFIVGSWTACSWDGPFYYRHDLKSLFCVMLLLACHYSAPGVRARTLPSWYRPAPLERISLVSCVKRPIPPVEIYFSDYKPWLGFIALDTHNAQIETVSEKVVLGRRGRKVEMEQKNLIPAPAFDPETSNGHGSHTRRSFEWCGSLVHEKKSWSMYQRVKESLDSSILFPLFPWAFRML